MLFFDNGFILFIENEFLPTTYSKYWSSSVSGYSVYATALDDNSLSLDDITCNEKTVFIIGNEGHGLSKDVIDASSSPLIIPMPGGAESLNASVASTILIWEMYKGINKK